jgi:hypothetical protein
MARGVNLDRKCNVDVKGSQLKSELLRLVALMLVIPSPQVPIYRVAYEVDSL